MVCSLFFDWLYSPCITSSFNRTSAYILHVTSVALLWMCLQWRWDRMHTKEISAAPRLLHFLDVVVLFFQLFAFINTLVAGFMYLFLYILGESPIEAGLPCNHDILQL